MAFGHPRNHDEHRRQYEIFDLYDHDHQFFLNLNQYHDPDRL